MRKPNPKTKTYLDWNELKSWLKEKDPAGWKKYGQDITSYWADGGDFHNGCFITLEGGMQESSEEDACYDPRDLWLAKILFEAYPEVSKLGTYGDIYIWVWW